MNKNNNYQIIQINSNLAVVSNYEEIHICKIKGIFKYSKINKKPVVGDYVKIQKNDDEYLLVDILERHNHIIRPNIANIDTVILVQSIVEPDFNFHLIMKFLAYYETFVDNVILVFTKIDVASQAELDKVNIYIETFKHDGYKVFLLPNEQNIQQLEKELIDKTFCFAGNSGVGKSTLINKLIPNLNLKTQEISKFLNRGKHTTTTSRIIQNENYKLIDTPGFSSIDINLITKHELARSFHDFKAKSLSCKFSNCLHRNEKNCAIKDAVEKNEISALRYEQYLQLLKEMK